MDFLLLIVYGKDLKTNMYSHLSKVLGNVKKYPYIINQNHIFFKKLLWKHFWIDCNTFYTKTFGIVYILFVYLLKSLYEWFLFVHNFSMIVNFYDLFLVEIYRKIKINFYLLCLNYVQIKITHNYIMSK